jgi:hypothetical protein
MRPPRTPAGHTFRWYGILPGERVPRNRHMNGGDWGWDATCTCGFDTRTGGAIQERIRDAIEDHLWDVWAEQEVAAR